MISPPTGVIAVAAHGSKKESFISTEGALRRPMTYAYMQKTCDVAEKAILAKKKLRKKCVNRDKM